MNDSETSIVREEVHPIEEIFEKTLTDFRLNMGQKRYRKVLEDIRNKEENFYMLENAWRMNEFKLKCIFKIINRKIDNDGGKYKSTDYWINFAGKIIGNWLDKLRYENDPENELLKDQVNAITELQLLYLYIQAMIAKGEHHIGDSAGFIALGIKTIVSLNGREHMLGANFLHISQNFYLFISSILISDKDFSNAILNINSCIKLCLKELYIRTDGEDYTIRPEEYRSIDLHYFNKLLTNLLIALYHKGVCEENLGDILKAIQCYSQARWINDNFKDYMKEHEIGGFIKGVENRGLKYLNTIKTLKEILTDIDLKDEKILNDKEKSNQYFFKDELTQFTRTKELIEKIKIPVIEEDENITSTKSKNVKNILSTVKMTFDLMSPNFKNIVDKLETQNKNGKFDIENLSKNFADQVQKRLVEMRVDKKIQIQKSQEKEKIKMRLVKSPTMSYSLKDNRIKSLLQRDSVGKTSKNPRKSMFNFVNKDGLVFKMNKDKDDKDYDSNNLFSDDYIAILSSKNKGNEKININNNQNNKINDYKEEDEDGDSTGSLLVSPRNSNNFLESAPKIKTSALLDSISTPNNKTNNHTRINSNTTALNSNYNSNINNNIKSNTFLSNNKITNKTPRNNNQIEKIKYDSFVFNMHYQRKLKFLDNISCKELAFQKKLLGLKKNEKFEIGNFDTNKIKDDAEFFFKRELKSKVSVFLIDESKKKQFEKKVKSENSLIKDKLEHNIIMSLNSKKLGELHKIEKILINEVEEQKIKYSGAIVDAKEEVVQNDYMEVLDKDLDVLSAYEKKLIKDLKPDKYRKEHEKKYRKPIFPRSSSAVALKGKTNKFVKQKTVIMVDRNSSIEY